MVVVGLPARGAAADPDDKMFADLSSVARMAGRAPQHNGFPAAAASMSSGADGDPLVGSLVDVGGVRVEVKRRIGEGGFAFVYQVVVVEEASVASATTSGRGRCLAMKRLLAGGDAARRARIVREISILKTFSHHRNFVRFSAAASFSGASSPSAASRDEEEFLVLMEFCPWVLSDVLARRSFSAATVAKVFNQVTNAVSALHASNPPIVHRDLKLENLLIDSEVLFFRFFFAIKLFRRVTSIKVSMSVSR